MDGDERRIGAALHQAPAWLVMAAALSVAVEPVVRGSIGAGRTPHSARAFRVGGVMWLLVAREPRPDAPEFVKRLGLVAASLRGRL